MAVDVATADSVKLHSDSTQADSATPCSLHQSSFSSIFPRSSENFGSVQAE